MARGHLYRPVTDSDGNVVPNTQVTVYEAGTSTLIAQPLYTQPTGSPVLNNPHTTSDGFVDFYLDRPQSVRIGLVVQGSTETYVDDIPVLPSPEHLVQATHAFQVLNEPADGLFLQAGQPGQAAWVDAGDLVNSRPSPLRSIYSYDFSGSATEDLIITTAAGVPVTPTFVDVTADPKPLGWEFFTGAVQLPTDATVHVRVPPQTWSETGTVIFLYKIVSANAGIGAAMLHVGVDADTIYAETPTVADLTNTWLVGYLDEIPSGSHRITVEHRPGTDLASHVLLGPIWLQYGNNIPAHDHPGTAAQTTRLGPGSEAAYVGATAVGALAKALDVNATVFGYDTQAGGNAVAVGALSRAGTDAVAVGYRASTLGKTGGVAVGKDAAASEDHGVAIGPTARVQGASGVAVGSGARTGSLADSVALGANAQALAYRSVALGQGALVGAGHDYSIAIGNGVTTTADHQARIGDADTTVVIPGAFRQVGGSAVFGAADKKLGFYGSAGINRPTVVGSRGGNATLASLLTLLASMGLIVDGTSG
jgi:hypothetical protein